MSFKVFAITKPIASLGFIYKTHDAKLLLALAPVLNFPRSEVSHFKCESKIMIVYWGDLARGHNASHIAESIVISLDTAKSHMRNIYRKLDIHTQQELLDLVE